MRPSAGSVRRSCVGVSPWSRAAMSSGSRRRLSGDSTCASRFGTGCRGKGKGKFTGRCRETIIPLARNQKFASVSLQRRVRCELDAAGSAADSGDPEITGDPAGKRLLGNKRAVPTVEHASLCSTRQWIMVARANWKGVLKAGEVSFHPRPYYWPPLTPGAPSTAPPRIISKPPRRQHTVDFPTFRF